MKSTVFNYSSVSLKTDDQKVSTIGTDSYKQSLDGRLDI